MRPAGCEILDLPGVRRLVTEALREDVGPGDATTLALVAPATRARARLLAREACVTAGLALAAAVFEACDRGLVCARHAAGEAVAAGDTLMTVEGPAGALLTAERTALNFAQRLGGIATLTRRFVDRVRPYGTLILDTRKTTPGWRALEKYAVRCGGGTNHRMGLYDRVMIKDNHRALWAAHTGRAADLAAAVREARRRAPGLAIEVEVETDAELASALEAGPEWILLDNMTPERLRACVARRREGVRFEASGGITLDNVEAVAATGVDAISLGCLTHSARAVDLSLEMEDVPQS